MCVGNAKKNSTNQRLAEQIKEMKDKLGRTHSNLRIKDGSLVILGNETSRGTSNYDIV